MEAKKDWLKATLDSYQDQLEQGVIYPCIDGELLDTMPPNAFERMHNMGFKLRVGMRDLGGQAVWGTYIDPLPRQPGDYSKRFCD